MNHVWLVAFIIGLATGSVVTNWNRNADEADLKRAYAEEKQATLELHKQVLREREWQKQALQVQLDQVDAQRYEELTHAQGTIDKLADELASAKRRVSVRTTCPTGSGAVSSSTQGTGLDDGAGERAELHPEVAAGLVRVAGEADRCRLKVTALQERMRLLTGEKN